jgi:hypothetical protein
MIQTDRERQIIALAQEQHGDDIEVIDEEDDGHVIERVAGAYCLAWVWVRFSGTALDTGQSSEERLAHVRKLIENHPSPEREEKE